MKILIVSWYFPPVNTIGAVRVGKFARFLIERGHDLGVVAGKYWGHPETLPLGVPLERVVYAKSVDVNALPAYLLRRPRGGGRGPVSAMPQPTTSAEADGAKPGKSAKRRLSDLYINLTNFPDNRVGWLPWLYSGCRKLCTDWRPDLVFASGPPFTAFLAAQRIAARHRLPWVAELRDRWADDPYDTAPPWRHRLDEWLERRVLASATALVTVTEPWAEFYRRKYDKPVATIYNGYDPMDFPGEPPIPESAPAAPIVIGYAGGIYPGRRDPSPLFTALKLMGADGERFRVVFRGTDPAHVLPLAEHAGVSALVEVKPGVTYAESLAFQQHCDLLLLMQWNDPREQGNCPGKFFEYMASLRPILILGLEEGVPATIARERGAGICLNEPGPIAEQLRRWLRERDETGKIARLPLAAREGLSRTIQFEKLESFLSTLVPTTR